jgi:hypothetical protein
MKPSAPDDREPGQALRFARIPNKGLRVNLAVSFAVLALVAGLFLAAAFVNQGFALPAAMILFCFGRFLFTGSCPGVQIIGRIRQMAHMKSGRSSE